MAWAFTLPAAYDIITTTGAAARRLAHRQSFNLGMVLLALPVLIWAAAMTPIGLAGGAHRGGIWIPWAPWLPLPLG